MIPVWAIEGDSGGVRATIFLECHPLTGDDLFIGRL